MKKFSLSTFCLLAFALLLHAQTPLPYYTGFSHGDEGWTRFNYGNTATYAWELVNIRTSPPDNIGLHHPSLEFANPGDTSIDWYVSPAFLFPNGGKIDSFAANVYRWGGVMDSIDLYVLIGSNNPSLATNKIKLANLLDMQTTASFDLRDTGNFAIPATTDSTYIAFRFVAVASDWYDVRIDDLYISANPPSIVSTVDHLSAAVYPNPAHNELHIDLANPANDVTVSITNTLGETVLMRSYISIQRSIKINTADLPPGLYFAQIRTGNKHSTPQQFTILK